MNLRAFHIVFVTCATTLCVLIGFWSLRRSADLGVSYLVMGVLCLLLAVGLLVYGVWFYRKIRTPEQERERRRRLMHLASSLFFGALLLPESAANACEVCYGAAESPMLDGARTGVFFLLGVILAVQLGIALFFLYLRRRAVNFGPQNVAPWWNTIEEPVKR